MAPTNDEVCRQMVDITHLERQLKHLREEIERENARLISAREEVEEAKREAVAGKAEARLANLLATLKAHGVRSAEIPGDEYLGRGPMRVEFDARMFDPRPA